MSNIYDEAEREYNWWLEKHHPEEFKRRWEEEDFKQEFAKNIEATYQKPRFDPYEEFEPSPAFVKQIIKSLNQEAYDLLQEQISYKGNSFLASLIPGLKRRHDKILNRIKSIQYRLTERERTGTWVLGANPNSITDEDKQRAKTVPITSFIDGRIRRSGKRSYIRCPFHTEKTGSMVIYEDQNTYHCYGCGENGDVIAFVQKQQGFNFIEAVRWLVGR